jgi:hypothetical protein
MRIGIFTLIILPGLLSGCHKHVSTWTIEDVEFCLVKNIPLDSVELEKSSFGNYKGTAIRQGKNYEFSAELNDLTRSLKYSMKGEASQLSQTGSFELMDPEKAFPNRMAKIAIISAVSALLVLFLQTKRGAKAVSSWGIIVIAGLAVVVIALMILNLVQR